MDKRHGFPAGGMLPAFAWLALASLPVRGEQATFNHDIRPILAENCFACHGPDSTARQADLRLDRREAAVKAGVIVPRRPEKSELVRRVFSGDADEMMPPPRRTAPDRAAKGESATVDRRGCGVPAAVVVPCACAAAAACGEEPVVGAARSTASFSPAWKSAGCNRPRRPTAARSPGG